MIQNAQRPIIFTGLNVMICNLNSFTKVMRRISKTYLKKNNFTVFFFIWRADHEYSCFVLSDV